MDLNKVKEFINLAKEEGVTELKCETKEIKLAVSFGGGQVQAVQHIAPTVTSQVSAPVASGNTDSEPGLITVTSPFVGTFYSASSPEKDPYVSIGTKVSKGSTLCILEAMKIMNEIEAEVSGEVVEICVENESLVEFGQPLFKIRA